MEKLEAALSKAREMRKSAVSGPAAAERAPRGTAARDGTAGDWTAIAESHVKPRLAQRNRLAALLGGREATPYDMLRSRTIRLMREKNWTRLAITSPDAGCGKSTVSLNLALSLSRQKDLKVMLLDLDLRRPAIARMLNHAPRHSVHEVLRGEAALEDCAIRIGANLIVAMNAQPARQPSELLQSRQAVETLEAIERRWRPDVMLFDLSPMLASDDNVGFLPNVDCALLVAAAESTMMPNIDICEKEIAQLTNVLGVVLNKCRYADDSVGYTKDYYG